MSEVIIWSLFGLSAVEIAGILFFMQHGLFKATEQQYVHKDYYLVFFVTFTVIALLFKLIILASLQQIYVQDDSVKGRETGFIADISCQIFLNSHVPQVFITMAVFVILLKTRLLYFTTQAKIGELNKFKDEQKKRLKRSTLLLRIFYLTTYVFLAIRYITTCNTDKTTAEETFEYETDHYIYTWFKLLFTVLLGLYLLLSQNKSHYF